MDHGALFMACAWFSIILKYLLKRGGRHDPIRSRFAPSSTPTLISALPPIKVPYKRGQVSYQNVEQLKLSSTSYKSIPEKKNDRGA